MSTERSPIEAVPRGEHSGGRIAVVGNVVPTTPKRRSENRPPTDTTRNHKLTKLKPVWIETTGD
jgi:hypothetical protein